MSTRPLIGLSTYREPARWGIWDQRADLLPASYADSVAAAGGVPVLLPPVPPYAEGAQVAVARLDGLIISGGADVDPTQYAESAHPATGVPRPDRDAWELALLEAAGQRGLPTLGVCRGMQVMAVQSGGTLEQHLPDVVGHAVHDPGGDSFGVVDVRVQPGSRLADVLASAAAASSRSAATTTSRCGPIPATRRSRGRGTAPSRRSRRPASVSCSVCSGTPRSPRTRGSSGHSSAPARRERPLRLWQVERVTDRAWEDWAAARPESSLLHLDSAAVGRSSRATLEAVAAHARLEAEIGGYVAQEQVRDRLDAARADVAGLLGSDADGVAFVESASAAFDALLDAWPLSPGDRVGVAASEWGPNLETFAHRGLVPVTPAGRRGRSPRPRGAREAARQRPA